MAGRTRARLFRGCGYLKTTWRYIRIRHWWERDFTRGLVQASSAWTWEWIEGKRRNTYESDFHTPVAVLRKGKPRAGPKSEIRNPKEIRSPKPEDQALGFSRRSGVYYHRLRFCRLFERSPISLERKPAARAAALCEGSRE